MFLMYIAKELLQRLVSEATQRSFVKAVYLHVLSTNRAAINFYEQNAFEQLQFLKARTSFMYSSLSLTYLFE